MSTQVFAPHFKENNLSSFFFKLGPLYYFIVLNSFMESEEGSKLGGRGVHFPPHTGKTPSQSLRNRVNSQGYPSIYEDWRPKIVEDIEKSYGETIKSGAVKKTELNPKRVHPNN